MATALVSGTLSGATVYSGDALTVGAGGQVVSTTVLSGGQLTISSGGGGSGDVVSGGSETVDGTEPGATLDAVQFGGDAPATLVVDPGASFSGFVAANAPVNDVLELASGSPATLSGLGSQFTNFTTLSVDSGADWTFSSQSSGGALDTFVYGTLSGATVYGGEILTAEAGGGVVSTTVESGGALGILTGGSGTDDVLSGGSELVFGAETSATVYGSGALRVESGGSAQGTLVSVGGMIVASGGVASGTILGDPSSGSTGWNRVQNSSTGVTSTPSFLDPSETVSGTETGAFVDAGGVFTVVHGGVGSGAVVSSGGQLDIEGGSGFGDTVLSGGAEDVGGTETAAKVGVGGVLTVESGGVLDGATLRGGLIELGDGGAATGVIVFASGADELEDFSLSHPLTSPTFGAILSGVKVGDTIDADIAYPSTTSLVYAGGVLTVSGGGLSETFDIAGAKAAGFVLSNDGLNATLVTGVNDTPPTITPQTPGVVEAGQSTVIGAVQTGAAGAALQLKNVSAADGTLGLVSTGSGSYNVVYAANAIVPSSVIDSVSYTVADTVGFSTNGSASVQLDAGPTLTQNAPTEVGHGQPVEIATVAPGLAGDTLTLSKSSGAGTLTISSGGVYYTAPSVVSGGQIDTLAYSISDQHNDATVSGGASIALDPGPTAGNGTLTLGHGQNQSITALLYSLILPGLAGDSETLTAVSATSGAATLSGGIAAYTAPSSGTATINYMVADQLGDAASGRIAVTVDPGPTLTNTAPAYVSAGVATKVGTATAGLAGDALTLLTLTAPSHGSLTLSGGNVVYQSSGTVPAGGESDSFKYEIKDPYGDLSTVVGASVTVDPGPTAKAGALTVGHSQSGLNETAYVDTLFAPGASGDGTAITAVSGATLSGGQVLYTPPASGSANFSYTVTDSRGQSASNTVAVTVDPGPKAANVAASVKLGQSVNLTSLILAAASAGLKGDTLTLTADNTSGTAGAVSLVNGQLVYTASGAGLAHIAANASQTDSFAFTISDSYGDTATATAKIAVSNPADVINGGPFGLSTIEGTAGADVINAYGWFNTIFDNGGNDLVKAGAGNATVYTGAGDVVVNLNGYFDTVTGGNGWDTVSGSQGNTTVTLGDGDDNVSTGGYSNAITVGAGKDTIVAGAGTDQVTAGAGVETIALAGYSDKVNLNGGTATVSGGQGLETVIANGGHDTLSFAGYGDLAEFSATVSASVADLGLCLRIDVDSSAATLALTGFGSADTQGVIDLLGGAGGYKSAAAAVSALHSDGHGGTSLSLGASGSIDSINAGLTSLHASNFQIG